MDHPLCTLGAFLITQVSFVLALLLSRMNLVCLLLCIGRVAALLPLLLA